MVAAKVYIAAVGDVPMLPVWPPERQAQLDATVSEPQRLARYALWKLLEHALWDGLGLRLQELKLQLQDSKWSCPECFFSLSHSDGAVAVAVSDAPVGVDIQAHREPQPALAKKILTQRQLDTYDRLPEAEKKIWLLERWCEKESLFKRSNETLFQPKKWESDDAVFVTALTVEGRPYTLAVTDPAPEIKKLFSPKI